MTEDDLRRAMVAASYEIGGSLHLPPNTAAYVAHRLANTPAPEVDPSFEKAKELWMLTYPSISERDESALKLGISAARMMERGA